MSSPRESSGTWENLFLPLKKKGRYSYPRKQGGEDEGQEVGSTHSTVEVRPTRDGGKGLTGRCIEEGK